MRTACDRSLGAFRATQTHRQTSYLPVYSTLVLGVRVPCAHHVGGSDACGHGLHTGSHGRCAVSGGAGIGMQPVARFLAGLASATVFGSRIAVCVWGLGGASLLRYQGMSQVNKGETNRVMTTHGCRSGCVAKYGKKIPRNRRGIARTGTSGGESLVWLGVSSTGVCYSTCGQALRQEGWKFAADFFARTVRLLQNAGMPPCERPPGVGCDDIRVVGRPRCRKVR